MSGSGGVSSSPLDDVRASAQINQPKIAPQAAFTADPDEFAPLLGQHASSAHSSTVRYRLSDVMKKAIVSLSIIGSLALVLFL